MPLDELAALVQRLKKEVPEETPEERQERLRQQSIGSGLSIPGSEGEDSEPDEKKAPAEPDAFRYSRVFMDPGNDSVQKPGAPATDPQEGPDMPTSDGRDYPPPSTQDAAKNDEMHRAVEALSAQDPWNETPSGNKKQGFFSGMFSGAGGAEGITKGLSKMLAATLPVAIGAAMGGKEGASLGAGVGSDYLKNESAKDYENDQVLHKVLLSQASEQAKLKQQLAGQKEIQGMKNEGAANAERGKEGFTAAENEKNRALKKDLAKEANEAKIKAAGMKPSAEDKTENNVYNQVHGALTANGNKILKAHSDTTEKMNSVISILTDKDGSIKKSIPDSQWLAAAEGVTRLMIQSRPPEKLIERMAKAGIGADAAKWWNYMKDHQGDADVRGYAQSLVDIAKTTKGSADNAAKMEKLSQLQRYGEDFKESKPDKFNRLLKHAGMTREEYENGGTSPQSSSKMTKDAYMKLSDADKDAFVKSGGSLAD